MTKITIKTGSPKFPITEELYGLFFEDINRGGDSGMYPEMIRNCTFEDSIIPTDTEPFEGSDDFFVTVKGHKSDFTHGEGLARWVEENKTPYTDIPAWYADKASMELDWDDTLNAKRRVSLKVNFKDGGRITNIGYQGVPVAAGKAVKLKMFAHSCCDHEVIVKLTSASGRKVYAEKKFMIKDNGYASYDCVFVGTADDQDARFVIEAPEAFCLHIGWISLMPADTYNGHGLRQDLVEKLAALKPGFMRFPGGCIVEGFNFASALKFSNMIGPVWERPTDWNCWAYCTANGFGYHEFLQLCEDLNMKKMWVFNCGMSCQARNAEYFEGEQQDQMFDEIIGAIEYATAPVGTKYGDMRAAAGHPEPFGLDYVEIGNENWGPEYNKRYEFMYRELKKRYPDIIYISNTHTEKDGLPTEIADEHFYSSPEFFAENVHKYDNYPRQAEGGPEIFVGECAVTTSAPGTLHAALGEAMFWMGLEKNQDIVKLVSYAPLFENVSFYNWYPNLICFDNTNSYGIPSWYMLKLMGENRGKMFVDASVETGKNFKPLEGRFGMSSFKPFSFKDMKIDGEAAPLSYVLLGQVSEDNGVYTTAGKYMEPKLRRGRYERNDISDAAEVIFGTEDKPESTFEVKAYYNGALSLRTFAHITGRKGTDVEWTCANARSIDFKIADGFCWAEEPTLWNDTQMSDKQALDLSIGWHDFKIVTHVGSYDAYVDGEKVFSFELPSFPSVEAVADTTDDTVIVKIVNFMDKEDDIAINLDCDVASDYTVKLLTGAALAENSITNPENVKDVEFAASGAAKNFVYKAPANSLSVLILKK